VGKFDESLTPLSDLTVNLLLKQQKKWEKNKQK
jgi:hypothetical protein